MRDPFLTGLNKVKDEKDFEETLRFACRLWSQDEILFNLTVLLLGFSESHLQTCSAKSHLQTCVAYGGIKRSPSFHYNATVQSRRQGGLCLA